MTLTSKEQRSAAITATPGFIRRCISEQRFNFAKELIEKGADADYVCGFVDGWSLDDEFWDRVSDIYEYERGVVDGVEIREEIDQELDFTTYPGVGLPPITDER